MNWMPHSHCVFGDLKIISLDVIGNLLTALAYMIIPVMLIVVVADIWDVLPSRVRVLLLHAGGFIFLCGATHVWKTWNWWHAEYFADACTTFFCGLVSISFALNLGKWMWQERRGVRALLKKQCGSCEELEAAKQAGRSDPPEST